MFVEREATDKRRSASHSFKFTEQGRKSGIGGVGPGVRYAQWSEGLRFEFDPQPSTRMRNYGRQSSLLVA
jgi:hypothetical protein